MKRKTRLPKLKTLEDYTASEIQKFDEMQRVLSAYNASIATKNELPLPDYTDAEMSEHSAYRQLVIAKQCED
jgi:hypothetical protein